MTCTTRTPSTFATLSSTPVTVTVCASSHFADENSSTAGLTCNAVTSPLFTTTATDPVGWVANSTSYVSEFRCSSAFRFGAVASAKVSTLVEIFTSRSSSSLTISANGAGSSTPLPPEAFAETTRTLSGMSVESSTAATVTPPVLVRVPAAILRVRFVLSTKLPLSPGAADTVTCSVTASLDSADSVAVTVLVLPLPLSSITPGVSFNATSGRVSSSSIVTCAPVTSIASAVPLTLTISSASKIPSSIGSRGNVPFPLAPWPGISILKFDTAL